MWRVIALALAVSVSASERPTSVKNSLMFLTRDGCVQTPDMVNNLDDALKALGWPGDYQYINLGTLSPSDRRTGYPTPTVLWKGKDLFGLATPQPPYDTPG